MTDAELAEIIHRHMVSDQTDWDFASEKARDHMDRVMLLAEVHRLRAIEKASRVMLKAYDVGDLNNSRYEAKCILRLVLDESKT